LLRITFKKTEDWREEVATMAGRAGICRVLKDSEMWRPSSPEPLNGFVSEGCVFPLFKMKKGKERSEEVK
jgi:hypothetical protein